jgi:hypothetical protein
MSSHAQEVRSQPDLRRQASALARSVTDHLPPHGARIAVAGCRTSLFDAFAQVPEGCAHGETDAQALALDHLRESAATVRVTGEDPMVEHVHRQAEIVAAHCGRDVDSPPLLSRSVIHS